MEASCLGLSKEQSFSAPTGKGKNEQSGIIFPIPGMARVWCFVLGYAACCLVDLDLSCPKTDRFWGLFYLSPTVQCQEDPKLVQILKSMNCEVCILTTQREMKTWL